MAYSNSLRTERRLRLLSAIVASPFAIRTRALLPLSRAISPSRIRTLRTMEFFQRSLATKNFRSISRAMSKDYRRPATGIMTIPRSCAILPQSHGEIDSISKGTKRGPPAEAARSGRAANAQSKRARLQQAVGLNFDRRIALRRHLATANI